MPTSSPIELEFSRKYDRQHAYEYLHKHQDGLARRLSHWRDEQMARRALKIAGEPDLVLDLPCGAGRFWPLLAEHPSRMIFAADNSADMLAIAEAAQPLEVVKRVETFQTSAFAIDMGDNAVDSIFCMRLLHHIADPAHRLAMLREFHRVTRDTLIVSLWVDGNYKAWKRRRLERRRPAKDNQNRFVVARSVIEAEFAEAGFDILDRSDFLPGYAMWRVYVLRKRVEHEPSLRTAGPRGADQHLSALVGHAWRVGRGAQPATRRRKRCAADSPARSAAAVALLQAPDRPSVPLAAASVRPAHGDARVPRAAGPA